MADELKPWEIHAAFTLERLTICATILWKVARDVALRMQPDRGDGAWGAGTARFERAVFAMSNAAKNEHSAWLSTELSEGHFLVKLCGVPVRFYRGDDELPTPDRYTKLNDGEVRDLQYALGLDGDTVPRLLRFEVQCNSKQMPLAVVFLQVEKGKKYNAFSIPIDEKAVAQSIARKRAPVDLPAPKVGPKVSDVEVQTPIIREENA